MHLKPYVADIIIVVFTFVIHKEMNTNKQRDQSIISKRRCLKFGDPPTPQKRFSIPSADCSTVCYSFNEPLRADFGAMDDLKGSEIKRKRVQREDLADPSNAKQEKVLEISQTGSYPVNQNEKGGQNSEKWIFENKDASKPQLDIAKLFEKDNDGDTVLHLTIVHNDEATTKRLVEQMRKKTLDIFNKLRQTPLHLAVLTCQPTIVCYLVQYGADVNVRDRNGQTPLHLACKNADSDSVIAIKRGLVFNRICFGFNKNVLDCNLKNFKGETALHLAVLSGSREIVKQLLNMGAAIDAQDGTSGRTGLHHAIEAHNIFMVEFLLQHKANIDARTYSGNTPLHTAMGLHMDEIAQVLIRHGANISVKNIEGDTPLDIKILNRGWSKTKKKRKLKTGEQKLVK